MAIEMTSKKFLSQSEIELVMENIKLLSLRDRLMIKLLMNLGMRGSELLEIKRSDVDFTDMTLHVIGKKGSSARKFPIPLSVRDELIKYIGGGLFKETDRIFPIGLTSLKSVWYRIRPCRKGIHSLRHTFAIEMFKKHRDIKLVKMLLGHRNIQNTMVYADYVYSTEEMAKVLGGDLYGTRLN